MSPQVQPQLSALESAGLLALAQAHPEIEYMFRHVLIQETVYDSILKIERRELHRITGEVLEELYSNQPEELAARLAEHFWQAGQSQKALRYSLAAAEHAARIYANTEAIESYSAALRATDDPTDEQAILRARGLLYETTGHFKQAREDLEAALALARSPQDEWQSLIGLGALWAARDYRQTGRYYRQALKLARAIGDPRTLATSLNRIGNYETNVEHPARSRRYHHEALDVFTRLKDETGIAETSDMLGMADAVGGDLLQAKADLEQALQIFELSGDRRSLASSLGTLTLITPNYQTEMVVTSPLAVDEAARLAERAVHLAEDIGWRSGIVYAEGCLTMSLISLGEYREAARIANHALETAQSIQHRQWEILSREVSGVLAMELTAYDQAREQLEHALRMARENYSMFWLHVIGGCLAAALIARGDLSGAARVLEDICPPETPCETLGQRISWAARVELALAQDDVGEALRIVSNLTAGAHRLDPGRVIVRLWLLRAMTLRALARHTDDPQERSVHLSEAERLLDEVLGEAEARHYRGRFVKIRAERAKVYADQGRMEAAVHEEQECRTLLFELAGQIDDPVLRRRFLDQRL